MLSTVLWPLAFVSFIAANPGFVAWLIGGLVSTLAILILGAYKLIYQRIGDLEKVDASISTRVAHVEVRLAAIEPNVGAGQEALNALRARIERHMTEEEDQVWSGIRSLSDKLSEIALENVAAHGRIESEHGQRLATIETQMEAVKRGLPNGDIKEMLAILKRLATA